MTYKDLAAALGYTTARVARAPLWSIQDFCLEKGYPPLTSIVVNQRTGVPGRGFKLGASDLGDAQRRAFDHDWSTVPRPFQPTSLARIRSSIRHRATVPPQFEVPDIEAAVNGRGPYQDRFRKLLLNVYGRRCALCDTRYPNLLVASHIIPWAQDSKNRLNPRNGILLCRLHDAAYEYDLVRIRADGTVLLADLRSSVGTDLRVYLKRTRDRLPMVPASCRPDPAFLQWRFERAKAYQRMKLAARVD